MTGPILLVSLLALLVVVLGLGGWLGYWRMSKRYQRLVGRVRRWQGLRHRRAGCGRQISREHTQRWQAQLAWLAGVQHDMRQPLHAMGLLLMHPKIADDPRLSELVERLRSCQRWLHELAENAMEATRMQWRDAQRADNPLLLEPSSADQYSPAPMDSETSQASGHVGTPGSFSLQALVKDIEAWMRPMADMKQLELELPIEDVWLQGDRRRLKRVIVNLLHNAVQHTDEGRVWLAYRFEPQQQHCLEVGDTGPGLPPDIVQQLFQASGPHRQSLPKRGLGLYVAKAFCAEAGWQMQVARSDERGTVYTIRLTDAG